MGDQGSVKTSIWYHWKRVKKNGNAIAAEKKENPPGIASAEKFNSNENARADRSCA
jgi:hypothetical protein